MFWWTSGELWPWKIPDIPAMKNTVYETLLDWELYDANSHQKQNFHAWIYHDIHWGTLALFNLSRVSFYSDTDWNFSGFGRRFLTSEISKQTSKKLFCVLMLDLWSELARDEIVSLCDSVHGEWLNRKKQHYCFPEKALWPLVSIAVSVGQKKYYFLCYACFPFFSFSSLFVKEIKQSEPSIVSIFKRIQFRNISS